MKDSAIEWTHHTFNPWWGCARVSPGCEHCYAEAFAKRTGHAVWGHGGPRRFMGSAYWCQPINWNRAAERHGERRRVFCASMADVFEEHPIYRYEITRERAKLWRLVESTPWLDWLLLTKRPQNIRGMLPTTWLKEPRPNVWLGTTCEDQRRAEERIPILLDVPAAVRFLSVEPQLGPVSLDRWFGLDPGNRWAECLCAEIDPSDRPCIVCEARLSGGDASGIGWVIVGGESGPGARPFSLTWGEDLVAQCKAAGVPVFFKQAGARPVSADLVKLRLRSRKGGDLLELPEQLRVRQFPEVRA